MAFVRPIVYVYRDLATIAVTPDTPDLNCCLVGPVFHIEDYPADADDIRVKDAGGDAVDFIKTGETKDAACASDGTSAGRPDAGTNFLELTEPPNHTSGAELDADSVDLVFNAVLIELGKATDGTATSEEVTFSSATVDFQALGAQAGDRIVMTDNANPGDSAKTVVKYIKEVTGANEVTVTKKFTDDDLTKLGGAGSPLTVSNALFRVEHEMADAQHIDVDTYVSISGNDITIKTSATGLKVTYNSTAYLVNYAEIYIGYRELRLDLQDVKTLDDSSYIASVLGKVDERNPVAAGAQVAFANTSTPIQIYGVPSDDLTGHTSARDTMSARSDIYAIVPLTDSISASSWTTGVLAMWKAHAVAFEAYDKAKYRLIIGSYPELPTEKASAPPSEEGWTLVNPDPSALVDVFVDPETSTDPTQFVTDGVGSTSTDGHYLDISHGDYETVVDQKTIFDAERAPGTPYAPVELYGAIGEKRLRTKDELNDGTPYTTGINPLDYVVRNAILESEGGAVVVSKSVSLEDGAVVGTLAGVACVGSSGDFAGVDIGDHIGVLTDSATYGNKAYTIIEKGASDEYITLDVTYTADEASRTVKVYEPTLSVKGCDVTGATNTVENTGAFADVADGDLAMVISSGAAANVGMWVVQSHTDDQVVLASAQAMTDDAAAGTHIIFYRTVASRGAAANVHMRKRLTRLRDDSASFLTTVNAGEMIEIPYPSETDPTKWDTSTTMWPIETVVSDEYLDADLETLEELAPDTFTEGFDGDMKYRISIELDKAAQVDELNTITDSFSSQRVVMTWPNEVYVTDLTNQLTGERSRQHGQYLACAVGGMIAGLPSHQGFTYIGIGGIEQIFNSNFYFTDDQITELAQGGWYVFLQDSESSLPYSAHEVTTDPSSYSTGELMAVKNFDYIALFFKEILESFLGRYNIIEETMELIRDSINTGAETLQLRKYPRIGAPLISADITKLEQLASEVDQLEMYVEVEQPKVLNKIGLHIRA